MTVRAPFGPMRGGSSGSWATRPGGCSSSKSRSCRFRNKTQKYRLMTRQFFSFLPSSSYFSIIMKINQSKVNIFLIVLSVSSFQPVMGIPCFLPSRIVSLSLPFRCQINFIKEWQWLAATWLFIYRKTDVLSPFWLCTTPSCSPPEKRLPPHAIDFRAAPTHTHGSSSKLVFVWMMRVFSASSPYRRETKRMAIARHCSSPPPSLSIPFG